MTPPSVPSPASTDDLQLAEALYCATSAAVELSAEGKAEEIHRIVDERSGLLAKLGAQRLTPRAAALVSAASEANALLIARLRKRRQELVTKLTETERKQNAARYVR